MEDMMEGDIEPVGVDSRLQAVIDKIEKREKKAAEKLKSGKQAFNKDNPPRNYEEFLEMENLDEWPERMTSEGPLALDESDYMFKSPDDVIQLLKEAAPIDLSMLDSLEEKLLQIESTLLKYSEKMVTDETRESKIDQNMFYAPLKAQELCEVSDQSPRRKKDLTDSVVEMRKKAVEFCSFPGFRKRELTELPSQLEAPQILNRVSKAQDYNAGFKKFWKKIFQSEASVAIMQDSFWWFFIEKFEKNRGHEQDLLFDRIADSFVALITSINPEIKDKFFQYYSDCLCQAIYATYYEAFPESLKHFNDSFKLELVNTINQWVTGVKPMPQSWTHWNIKRLLKKQLQIRDENSIAKGGPQTVSTQSIENFTSIDLDIDGFEKMVTKLGDQTRPLSRGATVSPQALSREPTKTTTVSSLPQSNNVQVVSTSRQAQCGTPKLQVLESHQIGPGPTLQRVMFNTFGRSPLVAHYLQMRELNSGEHVMKMKRTEIAKLPEAAPTYKELIDNRVAMSDALSKQYHKICEQTNLELLDIDKRKRDINKKINRLQKELLFIKDPLELKAMSERILDMRERNVPITFTSGGAAGSDEDDTAPDSTNHHT